MDDYGGAEMSEAGELKPCPFCGSHEYIESGEYCNETVWWDSALRYEKCGFVACYNCGAVVKADNVNAARRIWNRRV